MGKIYHANQHQPLIPPLLSFREELAPNVAKFILKQGFFLSFTKKILPLFFTKIGWSTLYVRPKNGQASDDIYKKLKSCIPLFHDMYTQHFLIEGQLEGCGGRSTGDDGSMSPRYGVFGSWADVADDQVWISSWPRQLTCSIVCPTSK